MKGDEWGIKIYGAAWNALAESEKRGALSVLESDFWEPWFHGFVISGGAE